MKVNDRPHRSARRRRSQAERSAATSAQLIAAGRALFSDKGFGGVSTQEIVTAAGVTRGALYHQFTDKAALFTAVHEELERDIVTEVAQRIVAEQPPDHLSAMRAGARLFLERCAAPDVQQIVLIDAPAVLGWEQWRSVSAKYGLGVIEAMLTEAVQAGEVPEQPVGPTAHALLGALNEAAIYVARAADPDQARTEMYAVFDRLIGGLSTAD